MVQVELNNMFINIGANDGSKKKKNWGYNQTDVKKKVHETSRFTSHVFSVNRELGQLSEGQRFDRNM